MVENFDMFKNGEASSARNVSRRNVNETGKVGFNFSMCLRQM